MAAALFIDLDKKSHAQVKEEGYRRPKPLFASGRAAATHSITSSAWVSSVGGTCVGRNPRTMLPPALVKPNFQAALAVFSSTFSTMTAVS